MRPARLNGASFEIDVSWLKTYWPTGESVMLNAPLVRVAPVRFQGFGFGIRLPQRALNCATVPSKLSKTTVE